MKRGPLVSISTLTYNHAPFLEEFFESVLAQDYDNLEIVIGDDCSTDGTREIIKRYQKKYPDMVRPILNERNLGVTKNAQNVLKACRGKYICTIAGDDLLLPGKIGRQVEVFERDESVNLVYHDLEVFYDDDRESHLFSQINAATPREGGMAEMIRYGAFAGACSIMLRHSAIPPRGFDERIPIASDWLFFVETVGEGRFVYIDEVLGKYRRHGSNVTSERILETLDDHVLSCAILLTKYPEFTEEIRYRTAGVLFEKAVWYMKNDEKERFAHTLASSLQIKKLPKAVALSLLRKVGFSDYQKINALKTKFKKSIEL